MSKERSTLRALLRATRPLAHGNIAPGLIYGQALAFALTGHFSWMGVLVAQGFGLVDHLVIVFANDYADQDADRLNTTPTPFSGGSRAIQEGELTASQTRAAAITMSIALLVLGAASSAAAPAIPWLAIAALALIVAYSYPPLRLSYRGGGELLQGLGVGVVLPMVGLAAQGATIEASTLVYLAPTFVLGVAGNVLTSIPDAEADRAAKKRSPAARWGVPRARSVSVVLHVLGALIAALVLPGWTGWIGLSIVIALQVASVWIRDDSRASTLKFVVLGGASEASLLLSCAYFFVYPPG